MESSSYLKILISLVFSKCRASDINFESPGRTPEISWSPNSIGVIVNTILGERFGIFWLQLPNGLHHSQWAWSLDDKQKHPIQAISQWISELFELCSSHQLEWIGLIYFSNF